MTAKAEIFVEINAKLNKYCICIVTDCKAVKTTSVPLHEEKKYMVYLIFSVAILTSSALQV